MLKATGCLQPCQRFIYSLEESYSIPEYPSHVASIFLKYKSLGQTEVHKEVYSFNFNDLAEGVGGLSGLLLGASLWSLTKEVFEKFKTLINDQ